MRAAGFVLLCGVLSSTSAFLPLSPVPGRRVTALRGGATGTSMAASPKKIVICGGGIQSASIAYYLSLRGVTSTVVERSEVACAASGKAGGFLARGWGSGPTRQLHEASFDLHEELARDLNLEGYRKLPTLQVAAGERMQQMDALIASGQAPAWLDRQVGRCSLMDDATAQTTPFELTTKMMEFAVSKGSQVIKGKVENIQMSSSEEGKVEGVVVDGKVVPSDCVVIAMGPWSCMAEDWFANLNIPMEGVRSTSIVFKSDKPIDPFALFCAEDRNGCHLEVYPRASNEVHVCIHTHTHARARARAHTHTHTHTHIHTHTHTHTHTGLHVRHWRQ